jgi:CubicO group peptidase (beta-lactamase class C family)
VNQILQAVESSRPQRKTLEADAATLREKYDDDEYPASLTQLSYEDDFSLGAETGGSSSSTLVSGSHIQHNPACGHQGYTAPPQPLPHQLGIQTHGPGQAAQPIPAAINLTPWQLTPEKLCEEIAAVARNCKAPAIGVAMVSPKGTFTCVQGVRKQGLPAQVGQNDKFITCLVSSVMVRVVLARIIDRGLFGWQTKIAQLLPELNGYLSPAHEDTTVAMVAANVAGLNNNMTEVEDGQLWSYIVGGRISGYEARRAVVVSYLTKPPSVSPSSSTYSWNQVNAVILMFILETMTGEAYETLLKRELLDPLGLVQTGFGQPDAERNGASSTPVQPWPHYMSGDPPLRSVPFNPDHSMQVRPATLWLHSVISDMARFCRFCIDGTDDAGAPLLTQASWERVFRRYQNADATCGDLFVCERPWGRGLVYSTCGRDMGFSSAMWIAPEVRKVFFTVANVDGDLGTQVCDDLASVCSRF